MAKKIEEGRTVGGIMLRKGHWYARIKVNGKQIWRSAPNKEAAQMLLGQLREDVARGKVGLPKVQRDTLADFAPRYMEWAKTRKRSWDRDELSLRPLLKAFGHFRLSELTTARVMEYMSDRLKVEIQTSVNAREAFARKKKAGLVGKFDKGPAPVMLSKGSINREVACLRGLLNYAVKLGELERNPIEGIALYQEAPGRLPALEGEDEARLLAALAAWVRPIYRLAVLTGCRLGELIDLRWRHIDFDRGILTVEDSKSGESRRIPLHRSLLEELRPRRGLAEGYVVVKEDGTQPKPESVSHAFRRAADAIGRPDLRWHDTRHLAGSRLLATGASLPEVAATLGHKTLAMSQRYSHVSPVRLSSLIDAMPAPAEPAAAPETEKQCCRG